MKNELWSKFIFEFSWKHYVAAQLEALRSLLKKTNEEAAFYDRQALAAQRFISPAGAPADAATPKEPSPADSLEAALAESSLEDPSTPPPHDAAADSTAATVAGTQTDRSRPSTSIDTVIPPPAARQPSARTAGKQASTSPTPAQRKQPLVRAPRARETRRALPQASARPPGGARKTRITN